MSNTFGEGGGDLLSLPDSNGSLIWKDFIDTSRNSISSVTRQADTENEPSCLTTWLQTFKGQYSSDLSLCLLKSIVTGLLYNKTWSNDNSYKSLISYTITMYRLWFVCLNLIFPIFWNYYLSNRWIELFLSLPIVMQKMLEQATNSRTSYYLDLCIYRWWNILL